MTAWELWTEAWTDGETAVYECRDGGVLRRLTLSLRELGILVSLALQS